MALMHLIRFRNRDEFERALRALRQAQERRSLPDSQLVVSEECLEALRQAGIAFDDFPVVATLNGTTSETGSTPSPKRSSSSSARGRGMAGSPPSNGGLPMSSSPQWKPDLGFYRELRALAFVSRKEVDKAIDLLWGDALREMPHDLVGRNTIIVPAEAVPYFQAAGLKFKDTEVLSAADLPAAERNKLRREQGPY